MWGASVKQLLHSSRGSLLPGVFLVPSRWLEGRRSVSVVNTSWRKTVSDGCHRPAVATKIRDVCTIRRWCAYASRVCINVRFLKDLHGYSCIQTCMRACVRAYGSLFALVLWSSRDDALLYTYLWYCPLRLSKVYTVITFTYSIQRYTCSLWSWCRSPRCLVTSTSQLSVYRK